MRFVGFKMSNLHENDRGQVHKKKKLNIFQSSADEPNHYDILPFPIVRLLFPSSPNQENIMIV